MSTDMKHVILVMVLFGASSLLVNGQVKEKAKSLLLGGNYREGIHGGLTIGNQMKSGLTIGYAPEINNMTINGSFKIHFKGSTLFTDYSPWNIRINPGLQLNFVQNDKPEVVNPNLALTFGRDINFGKRWGLAIETGVMYIFDLEQGYFPIDSQLSPAGGVKFFRNMK